MSLTSKLERKYKQDAIIADLGGYGIDDEPQGSIYSPEKKDAVVAKYQKELKQLVGAGKHGRGRRSQSKSSNLEGGFNPALLALAPIVIPALKNLFGLGLSWGDYMPYSAAPSAGGYPTKYKGSFPMPGFSPPFEGYEGTPENRRRFSPPIPYGTVSQLGSTGASLSGGRKRRKQSVKSMSSGQLAWQEKIRKYRESHPGVSFKETLIALKGR